MNLGRRRQLLQTSATLNGIEHVEVTDLPAELLVTLVNPVVAAPAAGLLEAVSADGHRIAAVAVSTVDPRTLLVTLARAGDLSPYTLRFVTGPTDPRPPAGIDPVFAAAPFRFAPQCAGTPCDDPPAPVPAPDPEPALDYLARDWEGFRRLLLDRLAVLQPDWTVRHPADVRTASVEAIAHLADLATYQHDAVETEAYLGTARRRISARRHARLVDYLMSDGANARTWVQLALADGDVLTSGGPVPVVPAGTRFLTAGQGEPPVLAADTTDEAAARAAGALEFAALSELHVVSGAHTAMPFYTWAGARTVLPAGATSATLDGALPDLAVGLVLMLVEHRDPDGDRHTVADADPRRRHPVRLTGVTAGADQLTGAPVTEISWSAVDALPFALTTSVEIEGVTADDAALALGNLVLVDHGGRQPDEDLGVVPQGRFRPRLAAGPVTQVPHQLVGEGSAAVLQPFDPAGPATLATAGATVSVLPAVRLRDGDGPWTVRPDLLASGTERHVTVEVDDEGVAWLRFGRRHGALPDAGAPPNPGARMTAGYRTGNGTAGNVGIGAVRQLLDDGTAAAALVAALGRGTVTNPVPGVGGRDPETIEQVRQRAPVLFLQQERAVTADDYARRAERFGEPGPPLIQRAVATVRWTGGWYTVVVAVDRIGGADLDPGFVERLTAHLDRYRMAGHDIAVVGARYVPLDVGLRVQVRAEHRRDLVRAELLATLSNGRLPDGRPGLFHPDRLTFGAHVYLGPIIAAVQAVPGVAYVAEVTRFARYRQPATDAKDTGRIELAPHEIARLDNDPSRPDRGILRLVSLEGGR